MNLLRLPVQPAHARRIIRDSAVLWLLVRIGLVLVGAAGQSASVSGVLQLSPRAGLVVVGVTVALVWFDGRRLNEHLLHANLGTPVGAAVGISAATAGLLEVLATTLLSTFAA